MTPNTKYPARQHAQKVVVELAKLLQRDREHKSHAIFVQSAPVMNRHDTDRELPFHQEANFSYLTGCRTPNSSVLILFTLDKSDSEKQNVQHQLFVPRADPLETMWSVAPPTLDESEAQFDSDKITYLNELNDVLKSAMEKASSSGAELVLHTLPDTLEFPALPEPVLAHLGGSKIRRDDKYLLDALQIARLTKDEFEIDLIREANRISSGAHEVLMRELGRFANKRQGEGSKRKRTGKEGLTEWQVESEGDAEALFVATCRRAGASQAYLPICASGSRASTLHYVCNDRLFPSTSQPRQPGDTSFAPRQLQRGCCASDGHEDAKDSTFHDGAFEPQVLLIDAGCEWLDYASDITRTIPVGNGGKYTEKADQIYELVLRIQKECEAMVKPGAHWDLIHLHAHRVLIEGFISFGIFTGTPEEVLQSGITAAFFPHGLGHSLGLDVHDSRQYLKRVHLDIPDEVKATPSKLYTYLRIRQPLQLNMVLTVEPGCYFAPQLMEEHGVWTSPLVDKTKLEEYVGVGGVRIEDVVVVRDHAAENLTTVCRERDEVESICSGSS